MLKITVEWGSLSEEEISMSASLETLGHPCPESVSNMLLKLLQEVVGERGALSALALALGTCIHAELALPSENFDKLDNGESREKLDAVLNAARSFSETRGSRTLGQ